MKPRTIIVTATLAGEPWAGPAWDVMQVAAGFKRLGHKVYYFEVAQNWPFDPVRATNVTDSNYALPYLKRLLACFGLEDSFAYRRSYSDHAWFGMERSRAEDLLQHADMVLNYAGGTGVRDEENLKAGRMVYYGTDPGSHDIAFARGDAAARRVVAQHDDFVTVGLNIGTPHCPIPPLPGLKARTQRAVLTDLWANGGPSKSEFTTICNWRQEGRDVEFNGDKYYWSKHREFLKFIGLPTRTAQPVELAMGLVDPEVTHPGIGDLVPARGIFPEERRMLDVNGWRLTDAHALSLEIQPYRAYIQSSRGEFTVAKDLNVRLRTGWFSERTAYYLAAGRPVVTQNTGFGTALPTGEGLFAFDTMDEILAAFDAINSDYAKHSRAARAIAQEYFRAETVLEKLLTDLGV